MGRSVDIHAYDYKSIHNKLVDFVNKNATRNKDQVGRLFEIMAQFGSHIGDYYIILNNEFYSDEYNAYYNLSSFIDRMFGTTDSFDIMIDHKEEQMIGSMSVEDAAENLNIELPEEEEGE